MTVSLLTFTCLSLRYSISEQRYAGRSTRNWNRPRAN